jgi:hypothetical protein
MVLAHVPSDRGRFGHGRRHTPTQGGVRVPSALAIEASGEGVTPSKRLRYHSVSVPRGAENAVARSPDPPG